MENNTSVLNIYDNTRDDDSPREKDHVKDYTFTSQDYFVHMLRFTWMCEKTKGKRILDIGCGKYTNLVKAITQMERGPHFEFYCGVDYGPIIPYRPNYAPVASKTQFFESIDWTDSKDVQLIIDWLHAEYKDEPFTIICFEVLEHMDFESQKKFMYNLSKVMHEPGLNVEACYFSTPNYNGSAAKNHISELHYTLQEEMFSCVGLKFTNAIGLSAWKKYHKKENVHTSIAEERTLDFLSNVLPAPLDKMMWGALLPRKYSNNIMYTLAVAEPLKDDITWELPHEQWRQGGSATINVEE